MSHGYRIAFGIRPSAGFKWSRSDKEQFVANCLSDGDILEWIKGTGIVHTDEPDKVLDAMLEHEYSIMQGGVLRWINVSRAEVTTESAA